MEPLLLFNLIFDVCFGIICCLEFHKKNKQISSLINRVRRLEADKRVKDTLDQLNVPAKHIARRGIIEIHKNGDERIWMALRYRAKLIRELPAMKRHADTDFYLFEGDVFEQGTHRYMATLKESGKPDVLDEVIVERIDKAPFEMGGIITGPTNAIV